MTSTLDPQVLRQLRDLAAMLREPFAPALVQLLDQLTAPSPPLTAPPAPRGVSDLTTLRY